MLIKLILITAIAAGAAFLVFNLVLRKLYSDSKTDPSQGRRQPNFLTFVMLGLFCAVLVIYVLPRFGISLAGLLQKFFGVFSRDPGSPTFLGPVQSLGWPFHLLLEQRTMEKVVPRGAVLVPSIGASMHSYIPVCASSRINDSLLAGKFCTSVCASMRNLLVKERTYYR